MLLKDITSPNKRPHVKYSGISQILGSAPSLGIKNLNTAAGLRTWHIPSYSGELFPPSADQENTLDQECWKAAESCGEELMLEEQLHRHAGT